MSDHRLWPGKSQPLAGAAHPWHPATFHCLDVTACALVLMNDAGNRMDRVAKSNSLHPQSMQRMFAFLIGLHDIGKLSEKFATDIGYIPTASSANNRKSHLRHWQISYALMVESLDEQINDVIGVDREHARRQLYAAVSGHHGRPPSPGDLEGFADYAGLEAVRSFVVDLDSLLPAAAPLQLTKTKAAAKIGWTLAGLTVVSDWVGSNQQWFPYTSPATDLTDYWIKTQQQAEYAVTQAGLRSAKLSKQTGLQSLFEISVPRPMQACAEEVELSAGPLLGIIEDVTGSGKTEAALVLAQRMMAAGKAEGIYVALPTMATANAMFSRLADSYRRLFDDSERPSLALAHAHRLLNEQFRQAVAFSTTQDTSGSAITAMPNSDDDQSVAAACNAWVADDKRRVFLADVGVGTIDQCFLGILPVKFSTLRLWGLGQRILIVDEAHACDSYMLVELQRLLTMQATLGGSAIVMTATLTVELRMKLAESFRRGLSQVKPLAMAAHYPALTLVSANTDLCRSISVASTKDTQRTVEVRRLETEQDLLLAISRAASDGCACVWVRNTVDQAISAATLLRNQGHDVLLFHARFAMADRLAIEKDVLDRFGKFGCEVGRRGRILIATQVVEQSLDLDFDWMASDLAPVDLLIQRAGRLWRHPDIRPVAERPCSAPVLHVLSGDPDVVDNQHWARAVIGDGGWVYDTATLWRTARALFDIGVIVSPDGLPILLEQVAGDCAPDAPAAIESEALEAEGQRLAAVAVGIDNVVVIDEGYGALGVLSPEAKYPTRLGQPSVDIYLVKQNEQGQLVPWAEDLCASQAASTVSLSRRRYERLPALAELQSDVAVVALKADWQEWQKISVAVVIVKDDGVISNGIHYDTRSGLHFDSE